jgi:hypothetical protein
MSYGWPPARLDGFTISAGYASGEADQDQYGGGMFNFESSRVLTDVTFLCSSDHPFHPCLSVV